MLHSIVAVVDLRCNGVPIVAGGLEAKGQGNPMRRPRRRSFLRSLFELLLWLVFAIGMVLVNVIILIRRIVPISLLLLIGALVPLVIYARTRNFGDFGSWLMLATAIALAFAAGTLKNRR